MEYNNKKGILLVLSFVLFLFVLLVVSKSDYIDEEKIGNSNVELIDFENVNNFLNSGNFISVIEQYETKGINNLTDSEKIKLVSAYLGQGNYFYKESEFSKKSLNILNTLEDNYSVLYYKGYANEIVKNYDNAISFYDSGLKLDLSDTERAILLNQKGHLLDLQGNLEEAYKNYTEANNYDNNNIDVISNLGRYYARKNDFEKAVSYFKDTLKEDLSLPEKAETYFTISSLLLEIGGLYPNLDESIEYSKKAIEIYPEYPMGYIALAKGLYMKNDPKFHEEIVKNINIALAKNPNSYYAYEILGLLEYDKGNLEEFLNMFLKAEKAIDNDMILMDNQRQSEKDFLNFKYYVLSEIEKNKDNINGLFEFINNLISMPSGKGIIIQQLRREKQGNLGFLSSDERFDFIIEELNK